MIEIAKIKIEASFGALSVKKVNGEDRRNERARDQYNAHNPIRTNTRKGMHCRISHLLSEVLFLHIVVIHETPCVGGYKDLNKNRRNNDSSILGSTERPAFVLYWTTKESASGKSRRR
jgi:hypothetical protein